MPIYGNTSIAGAYNSASWPFTLWANMNLANQGVMPTDGLVSSMHWYGHVHRPGTHIKGVIYDIDVPIPPSTATIVAQSVSTAFPFDPGGATDYYWHTLPMSALLTAGKSYGLALVIAKEGVSAPYIIGQSPMGNNHCINVQLVDMDSAPDPYGTPVSTTFFMSFYITYDIPVAIPHVCYAACCKQQNSL